LVVIRHSHNDNIRLIVMTSLSPKQSAVEADEEILTFDVSDDVLERIGGADQKAVTWAYALTPGITASGRSSV